MRFPEREVEDGLAEVGDERVAHGGHAHRADVADGDEGPERVALVVPVLAVELVHRGGHDGAQGDVQGVQDVEDPVGRVVAHVPEEEHDDDAGERPEHRERRVALELLEDGLEHRAYCMKSLSAGE